MMKREERQLLENHLRKLESKLLRQQSAVAESEQVIKMYRAQLEAGDDAQASVPGTVSPGVSKGK